MPDEITNWQNTEKTAAKIFYKANFKEIRTPVFEDEFAEKF